MIVATVLELCKKSEFFLKQWMKEDEDEEKEDVLEFILTFDQMQNTSPLMCTKFEI